MSRQELSDVALLRVVWRAGTAAWNSSQTMARRPNYYDHVPELQPTELARLLRQHGVPAVLCADCGKPVTDRHPRWAGIWVTPDSECGPLCGDTEVRDARLVGAQPLLGTIADQEFGLPHRPAETA
ncbi:hypothetical protein [Streptomyces prunicolor]